MSPARMLETLRRLTLGLVLIAAASSLLLLSDMGARVNAPAKPAEKKIAKLAILQHASQAILDQGREGMIAGLAERGWVSGDNLQVRQFNAEGDMAVSQAIAREMVNGGNDILMTISTPSLQAVANANKAGTVPHVFGLVTSPVAAGVGIKSPTDHPAWLAGYGTMQPIALAFKTALAMNPNLKTVGVVWNASEANAEAQVKLARQVCAELGLTLSEATVENSAGVGESAAAVAARGVDAIWVPGDVTVITAIDSVVAAGQKANIPVFSVIPPNVKRGTLFDVGADYHEVGRLTGLIAGDILNGRKAADISIDNVMPEMLAINQGALADLKGTWSIPPEMLERATLVIDQSGAEKKKATEPVPVAAAPSLNPSGKKWKIALITYTETLPAEETLDGMKDGWKESGLVEGKDYELKLRSAQGDMAMMSGIMDTVMQEGADIVVPISTPTLQSALNKIRRIPIVFTLVANPMAAGAGKSYTEHLPNVTGVAVISPYADMLDLLEKYYPNYKKLGTLYCPSETNSVDLKDALEALCKKRGFTLEVIAANSPSDLPDAALSLASRPIDAIVQISDNLSSGGFTTIAKAARQAKKPLFSLNSTTMPLGSPLSIGRDYHAAGVTTVKILEQVIAGKSTADIPFTLPPKVLRVASPANAEAVGMTLPPELLKTVDKVAE